jgi:hypothetical protein
MKLPTHWRLCAALTVPVCAAEGAVTLEFAFAQGTAFIAPNSTAEIPLYLRETVTGSDSSILLTEQGVAAVGVRVTRTSPAGPEAALFAAGGGIVPSTDGFADLSDPLFGPLIINSPDRTSTAMLLFGSSFTQGVMGSVEGPGIRTILLGRVRISVGAVEGQATVFTAGDFADDSSDTITWRSFDVLDDRIRPGVLEVVVTPAPGAGLALGLGLLGLRSARRRG